MGALSLTASKPQQRRRFSPLMPGVTHVNIPIFIADAKMPRKTGRFALSCARSSRKLFKTTLPPEEVAAIFVEPVQGEGGYVVAPTIFMQELRRICDRHGILLVLDEVQSGIGRTGQWWAVEHTGVEPDMVCIAKGIAPACRWASHDARRNHGLGAGFARIDFRRQSGVRGGCAGYARRNRERKSAGALGGSGRAHDEAHGQLAGEAKAGGRCARTRADDRRRHREGQDDQEYGAAERDLIVEKAFEHGVLFLGCGPSTIRYMPAAGGDEEEATLHWMCWKSAFRKSASRTPRPSLGTTDKSVQAASPPILVKKHKDGAPYGNGASEQIEGGPLAHHATCEKYRLAI